MREISRDKRIAQVKDALETLPKGTLTYKKINGKMQPYLQRNKAGHCVSYYIKVSERELVMEQLQERERLQNELKLLMTYQVKVAEILAENPFLANPPAIGYQDYEKIAIGKMLYVDKSDFIREWWESFEQISLITRPRRFGKTLMLSFVNCFFSTQYRDRGELFEKLKIWKNSKYRKLQGQYPVILFSLSGVKSSKYENAVISLCMDMRRLFDKYRYILDGDVLSVEEKELFDEYYHRIREENEIYCYSALKTLCELLYRYHDKKVIVLLDEYDTPMQEAYLCGYWDEMSEFMRNFLNCSFKNNEYLERGLITGIARVAKESLFSDLNNLAVHTVTSDRYAASFGFTEKELFDCFDCQDIEEKAAVKDWYDGFTIGNCKDIYNPWSMVNYISERKLQPYWANSGGYGLISKLFIEGKEYLKNELEVLMNGGSLHKIMNENVTFDELSDTPEAIWPLLLATGYVKADSVVCEGLTECDISITNKETLLLFRMMVKHWFSRSERECSDFARALIEGNIETMNMAMNEITLQSFSVFDTGNHPSGKTPERFYHGFVLGLLVELKDDYEVVSNRESGYGRCDVMLYPKRQGLDGIILEFKVRNEKMEKSLEDTVAAAKKQIEDKKYAEELTGRGIDRKHIRYYGFGFEGKKVLIG